MKLYLIASILLLAPLVSVASPPPQAAGKIIYSDGYILTEFSNLQDVPYIKFSRIEKDSLKFYLYGPAWNDTQEMFLSNRPVRRMRDGKVSFVIEAVARQHGITNKKDKQSDLCKTTSSPELRPLIERCRGQVSVRMLKREERRQMEAFKADAEGKNIHVSYYPGESGQRRLVSKTVDAVYFYLFGFGNDFSIGFNLVENADPDDSIGAYLTDFKDKRFVVEGPVSESNCENSPVAGLGAVDCRGVRITDGSDETQQDGNPTLPNKAADIPLENLSAEELKKLLGAILGRL